VPGVLMLIAALCYFKLTQDTPAGNFALLQRTASKREDSRRAFLQAASDPRVWALFVIYGACFGVEITIHNVAALYFVDNFHLSLQKAGLVAGSFGILALFARTLGGFGGDRAGMRLGLKGRASFLGAVLLCEGLALLVFSQARLLPFAVASLLVFGLFVHMSAGATYSVVPFINRRALGAVAGIVGAGGNAGAVLGGLLFRSSITTSTAFMWLGVAVVLASSCALLLRFNAGEEVAARESLPGDLAVTPAPAE